MKQIVKYVVQSIASKVSAEFRFMNLPYSNDVTFDESNTKSNIFIVAYTNKSNDTLFDNTLFKYNYLGLCKFSDIIL